MNNTISTQQRKDKRQQKHIVRILMKSKPTNILTFLKKKMHKDKYKATGSNNLITTNKKVAK